MSGDTKLRHTETLSDGLCQGLGSEVFTADV